MLGLKHISNNWALMYSVYIRLAIAEYSGNLEEYLGLKGQIRTARELGVTNLVKLRSEVLALGIADDMRWESLNIPTGDLRGFDPALISALIAKAREHGINLKTFRDHIYGRSNIEAEVILDLLINKGDPRKGEETKSTPQAPAVAEAPQEPAVAEVPQVETDEAPEPEPRFSIPCRTKEASSFSRRVLAG
jgi:hypothetical protein